MLSLYTYLPFLCSLSIKEERKSNIKTKLLVLLLIPSNTHTPRPYYLVSRNTHTHITSLTPQPCSPKNIHIQPHQICNRRDLSHEQAQAEGDEREADKLRDGVLVPASRVEKGEE